jgi:hypothetical protein
MRETNWAGNHTYRAAALHRPASVDQVRELVAGASRLRVLGSRHSFTDIADSEVLLSLDGLPAEVAVDRLGRRQRQPGHRRGRPGACGPWPGRSGPCSRCRSCGRWPPTGCG